MVLISVSMIASVFTGCGNSTEAKDSGKAQTEQADTKEDSADKADDLGAGSTGRRNIYSRVPNRQLYVPCK